MFIKVAKSNWHWHILPIAMAMIFIGLLFVAAPEHVGRASTIITVNSAEDNLKNDGFCTLREAIIAANKDQRSGSKSGECAAGSGADEIILPAGTYNLTRTDSGFEDSSSTGDLDITSDIKITGAGANVTLINAINFKDRVIHVLSGNVSISEVMISGGNVINGNGGAIENRGTLALTKVSLNENRASGNGGAIFNSAGAGFTAAKSVLRANSALGEGGGFANAGTAAIQNTTISGNLSNGSGGGIFNTGSLSLNNVTVANNTADSDTNEAGNGGGTFNQTGGTINVQNSIVAANHDQSPVEKHLDCSGTLNSLGYNLIQSQAGCTIAGIATGNLLGVEAKLEPLGDYGGPTLTHNLAGDSPAIDSGNPGTPGSGGSACEATDQRGVLRPSGPRCDIGAVEVERTNAPILIRAVSGSGGTVIDGRLFGESNQTFSLTFYHGETCIQDGVGAATLGPVSVTTDSNGNVVFHEEFSTTVPTGNFISATATDANGNVSPFSRCILVGAGNDSWPNAARLNPSSNSAAVEEYIDLPGQSRWYKFKIDPGSRVIVTLSSLPENYDLVVYKDIASAFAKLSNLQGNNDVDGLTQLSAEFAADAFTADAFTADAFTADAFTADAFTADAFTADAFTADAFTADAFTADAFTADAFTADAFTADAFTADAFTADAFTADAFTPDASDLLVLIQEAFSSAQTRSVLAASANPGTLDEQVTVNTWNNSGDFYVRVRGRNGAFSISDTFQLEVQVISEICGSVAPVSQATTLNGQPGGYHTIILTDLARTEGTPEEKSVLQQRLAQFAARAEVSGVVVDVGADAKVQAANSQADAHPQCPYAKNLAAEAIKQVVDSYWSHNQSTMEYVVIVGNDDVIAFYRYPDNALLANEKDFWPPVKDDTTSQASLRLGYVLGQDFYGASKTVEIKNTSLPIPDLAVGRLVETAPDVTGMLDAYLLTTNGVLETPDSAFVSGYDFLEDNALAVQHEFETGGTLVDTLITDRDVSPTVTCSDTLPAENPLSCSWTAQNLKDQLFTNRHDLIYLAGHFSANSALAADYSSRVLASELVAAPVDLTNALVLSPGCHSGYNIVNEHGIPQVTGEPDWAQAFARKRAILIAGTGYQYGETDFMAYSESLYLAISQQLRAGTGPVAIGKALNEAKMDYLSGTPQLRGIEEKAYLEATLFGPPMMSVNFASGRGGDDSELSRVPGTTGYDSGPGATLDLQYHDLSVNPALSLHNDVVLKDPTTEETVTVTYLSGKDGVETNPGEPVLPLELYNVSVADLVLRGIGLREGTYNDLHNILPYTGAAVTEIRGVHTPFPKDFFYPVTLWSANYFDKIADPEQGSTRLAVTPAQHRSSESDPLLSTLRAFSNMKFRLFYSANTQTYVGGSIPADAAAPSIAQVSAPVVNGNIHFSMTVLGNPNAGIQEVWITYTSTDPSSSLYGKWQSLDLSQNLSNSKLWEGVLEQAALQGALPEDVRFIVQAVNGSGLVGLVTNFGAYFTPELATGEGEPTNLTIEAPVTTETFGSRVKFAATLTNSNGEGIEGTVKFKLGPLTRSARTGAGGRAEVDMVLLAQPGDYALSASYAGSPVFEPTFTTSGGGPFTVTKQVTTIELDPNAATGRPGDSGLIEATLLAVYREYISLTESVPLSRPLTQKPLVFEVTGSNGSFIESTITDLFGKAKLGSLTLPPGSYQVTASYAGTNDGYLASTATGTIELINQPPDCSAASPVLGGPVWPPNNSLVPVNITGITDPEGDPITITFNAIRQDEPTGNDSNRPDGFGVGTDTALIRSQRDGSGDGRVYHFYFTASDGSGGTCSVSFNPEQPEKSSVRVGVVENQGMPLDPIDGGPLFDSTVSGK